MFVEKILVLAGITVPVAGYADHVLVFEPVVIAVRNNPSKQLAYK